MTARVNLVLHRATKPPVPLVNAYLDRPAIGTVVMADCIEVQTADPQQLFTLAGAFWKAATDLEQQQAADAQAATQVTALAQKACRNGQHGYCDLGHAAQPVAS